MEELIGVLNYTDLKVNSSGGGDLSNYYTKGETDNQIKKSIDKIKVPTKISELSNDAGYLTQHQDISNLATKSEVSAVENKIPAAYELPTASATTLGGVKVGSGLSITNGVLSATGGGGVADSVEWDKVQNKPNFANVATSGDYNDLSNKPTIPSVAGLASEAYVNEKVAAIKVPSLDGYAKTADLSTVATSGSYNDLADKPTIPSTTGLASEAYVNEKVAAIVIPEVPTKVSELENDSGYLTEHQSLAEYAKKTEIPAPYTLPVATKTTLGGVKVGAGLAINDGVLSATGGGTADSVDWGNIENKPSFSTVATSGSYNDLLDKPIIPSTAGLASTEYVDAKVGEIVIPTVPTKVSELENDSGYLTEHQSLAEYAKKTEIPAPYTLPTASTSTLGGVKVDGNTITIADGVISAKGGSGGGTADVFTGAGEDTITTEKTFEDSSFSFNKGKFLDNDKVKQYSYGWYKLSSENSNDWLDGKSYYSSDEGGSWRQLEKGSIQGGSTPYGCNFNNSAFYVSGTLNTIIIKYEKGAAGTAGLVPAPTDNGKVLGSNGEWISVNMVSTINTGSGLQSEKFNDNNNIASGKYSHAEGEQTEATTEAAHAEGYKTYANGNYSHAEGKSTETIGQGSHTEGYNENYSATVSARGVGSHIEGYASISTAVYAQSSGIHIEGYTSNGVTRWGYGKGAHIEGWNTLTNSGTDAAHVEGYYTIADAAYHHIEGKYNLQDGDAMYQHIAGNGTSSNRSNSHTLDWQGNAVFAGTVSNSGADYAEYFEWLDENENVDDRVGYIVTLEGNKIKFANSEDDVLGIVSGTATVLGDNAEWEWQGKYLKDEFGRKIIDWVEHKSTTTIYNDDGTSKEKEISLGFFPEPRINPAYNENEEYVNRYWRPEWDAVGLMGKLFVRDNGNCQVGSYVKPDNGIAIPSEEKTNMRVLKRVNDNVIQVLLK